MICFVSIEHERNQFHPELFDAEHTAGRRLIANFLKLAAVIA